MSIGGQDHNQPQLFKRLIADAGAVANRIDQLGAELTHHYSGKRPLFICLLRGGAPFATQLMFAITRLDPAFHPELDYMTITTYGDKRTGGDPRIVMDQAPKTEPEGRSVVILDDVLDMGIRPPLPARLWRSEEHSMWRCACWSKNKLAARSTVTLIGMVSKLRPIG